MPGQQRQRRPSSSNERKNSKYANHSQIKVKQKSRDNLTRPASALSHPKMTNSMVSTTRNAGTSVTSMNQYVDKSPIRMRRVEDYNNVLNRLLVANISKQSAHTVQRKHSQNTATRESEYQSNKSQQKWVRPTSSNQVRTRSKSPNNFNKW